MTIIEQLTMAEIEEILALNGGDFEQFMSKGIQPGRPLATLAWVLAKRNNPNAQLETYMAMNMDKMNKELEAYVTDPKATTSD